MGDNERMDKALEILAEENVTNRVLTLIVCSISDLQESAWKTLCSRSPSRDDLLYVAANTKSEEIKKEALNLLFEKNPSKDDLLYVFINLRGASQKVVWEKLKDKKLTKEDLYCIVAHARNQTRREAWNRLKEKHPKKENLDYMFPDIEKDI